MPCEAVQDGRYIYYAFEMSGVRMGIKRYDTKTHKKKLIVGYKNKGEYTNGFYDLSVSGNYIYALWDQGFGTDDQRNLSYIYRFSKDGKKKEKLALGNNPILIGDYIYYTNCRSYYYQADHTSIYRMKKDGTGKKKIHNFTDNSFVQIYKYGKKLLYTCDWRKSYFDLEGKKYNKKSVEDVVLAGTIDVYDRYKGIKLSNGKYTYYLGGKTDIGDYTKLYRKNKKAGDVSVMVKNKGKISKFVLCGKHLMIKALDKNIYNVYIYSSDGKLKKKLESWTVGE